MRMVYITDLHGWSEGYERALEAAINWGAACIVNGGDMFPSGEDLLAVQASFLNGFFADFLRRCEAAEIAYYGMFANEDAMSLWPQWKGYVDESAFVFDLTEGWRQLADGVWIGGCAYVPDHPYRLKDFSVRDLKDIAGPAQREAPVRSTPTGLEAIGDLDAYFRDRPTLEDKLKVFSSEAPEAGRRIAVIHAPPVETGLGVLPEAGDVGSFAVRQWIERHQPFFTLHGHIHESPDVTGMDTCWIRQTQCHQPGQRGPAELTFSRIEITEDEATISRCLD